jgi:uncharacterized protein YjcR
MARTRDPNRDKAFEIWKQRKGDITNRAIAEQLDIDEKKVAVWKQRDKWNVVQQTNTNVVQQKKKKGAKPKGKPRYPNGHPGNKNPANQFTERNQKARKHGLFSRYMPAETLAIMNMIDEAEPADLIWTQIQIQYAAIIRSQQIMHVEDKDETIREIKKTKSSEFGDETEYEIQFAWDRQATFLTAQSRALSELRASIKQFDEMAHVDDERRLKLENMRLTAEKTKAELKKLEDGDAEKPIEIFISRKEVRGNGETS